MRRKTALTAALLVAAVLVSSGCLVKLSSDPHHAADGRKLNPNAYVSTDENVSVVVGTKLARHSRSDSVLPLQILVRNNSSEILHVEAANFVLRDEFGIDHPPVPPAQIKPIYKRVNYDYELANTTEFIGLLNSGMGLNDNILSNFYPNNSNRLVLDRFDMPSVSRFVDILYYEVEGWRRMTGTLTMVVKNLRDRPPIEVTFSVAAQ